MTFRERCALAAMREEMRDSLRDDGAMAGEYFSSIATEAWRYADAMEAERAKRAVPSVADPSLTCAEVMELGRRVGKEEMDAACEKARREGRAQGIRDARGHILDAARDAHGRGHGDYDGLVEAERVLERIAGQPPRDEVIASENAKLRAVAEAAARLQRWNYDDNGGDHEGEMARAVLAVALDAALPGWRTK